MFFLSNCALSFAMQSAKRDFNNARKKRRFEWRNYLAINNLHVCFDTYHIVSEHRPIKMI